MITPHLFFFFFTVNAGGGSGGSADTDAPIMLVRFAKMGIR